MGWSREGFRHLVPFGIRELGLRAFCDFGGFWTRHFSGRRILRLLWRYFLVARGVIWDLVDEYNWLNVHMQNKHFGEINIFHLSNLSHK